MPFTPILEADGLLRVGGKLNKSPLTYSAKHLILHSKNKNTTMPIEKAHDDSEHREMKHVKAHLLQAFTMIGLRKFLTSPGQN